MSLVAGSSGCYGAELVFAEFETNLRRSSTTISGMASAGLSLAGAVDAVLDSGKAAAVKAVGVDRVADPVEVSPA